MADGNGIKPEDTANSFENSISTSKAEWLKPYHWPKGISGNPSGRPRKPITDAYADLAEQKYPGDPKGRTYAQVAAEGQFNAAIKGKTAGLELECEQRTHTMQIQRAANLGLMQQTMSSGERP